MSQTKTIKVPEELRREAQISFKSDDGNSGKFEMSISSDEPYLRRDWWNDEDYYEVIDHSPGAIKDERLKAGLPILFNHDRDQHLATAKSYNIDGKKCVVSDLVWSASDFAQTKKKDAESGALTTTSVGYRILDDGVCIGARDGIPVYKFKVEIFEGSLVTIPADISVGVGRQRSMKPTSQPREITVRYEKPIDLSPVGGNKPKAMDIEALQKELDDTKAQLKTAQDAAEKAESELKDAQHKALADAEQAKKDGAAEAIKSEDERIATLQKRAGELQAIHKKDFSKALVEHIAGRKSVADFDSYILTKGFSDSPLPTGGELPKGAMKREAFFKLSPADQKKHVFSGGTVID